MIEKNIGLRFCYEGLGPNGEGHNDLEHAKLWACVAAGIARGGGQPTQEARDAAARFVEECEAEADSILRTRWPDLQRLAAELREHGTLGPDAIAEILGPRTPNTPETIHDRARTKEQAVALGWIVFKG